MYIQKVEIKNIRSISHFEMDFPKPAGWHVLIGDNGTGKSSIIKSIALGLVGLDEISGIKPNWNDWMKWGEDSFEVFLKIKRHVKDVQGGVSGVPLEFKIQLRWKKTDNYVNFDEKGGSKSQAKNSLWGGRKGWFSAGYGPFRRFSGGSYEMDKVFEKFYRLKNSKTGGTGLGLSIAKGFVEAHKGRIDLLKVPAGGAKFLITIPAETSSLNKIKNE